MGERSGKDMARGREESVEREGEREEDSVEAREGERARGEHGGVA